MVLQDLVNELGRRLDYRVTNGRYQGTANAIGFDGIWVSPEGHTIVTEVKTTDAYRISLDTIAGYREKLIAAETIAGESSILIVVGRQDTGELEAQIRGSRHAWDIRLISADALIKLIKLKENSDDPETVRKIRSVLAPVEYTRLDKLVDVMFTTATDVEPIFADEQEEARSEPVDTKQPGVWEFTDASLLQLKRDEIIAAASKSLGAPLVKKTRALFWSSDHAVRVVCTISKRYDRRGYPYWYAYHPQWDEFLSEGEKGYLILGCMDLRVAFVIPRSEILAILEYLNQTETERGTYWHLHIVEPAADQFELLVSKGRANLPLSKWALPLAASA